MCRNWWTRKSETEKYDIIKIVIIRSWVSDGIRSGQQCAFVSDLFTGKRLKLSSQGTPFLGLATQAFGSRPYGDYSIKNSWLKMAVFYFLTGNPARRCCNTSESAGVRGGMGKQFLCKLFAVLANVVSEEQGNPVRPAGSAGRTSLVLLASSW